MKSKIGHLKSLIVGVAVLLAGGAHAAEPVMTATPIAWTLSAGPAIVEGYRIYAVTVAPTLRADGLGSALASVVAPKLVGEVKLPTQASAIVTFPQETGKRYWLVLTSYGPSGESTEPTSLRRQYSEPVEVTYGIDLSPEAPGAPRRTGPVRLVAAEIFNSKSNASNH